MDAIKIKRSHPHLHPHQLTSPLYIAPADLFYYYHPLSISLIQFLLSHFCNRYCLYTDIGGEAQPLLDDYREATRVIPG